LSELATNLANHLRGLFLHLANPHITTGKTAHVKIISYHDTKARIHSEVEKGNSMDTQKIRQGRKAGRRQKVEFALPWMLALE